MGDWFRSSMWSEVIAEEFELRLRRARPASRPQYVRIQGLTLADQEDSALREVGRNLLRRVAYDVEPGPDFQALAALEELGESLFRDGHVEEAEAALREVVARIELSTIGRSGTTHVTELTLAELFHLRGGTARLHEASRLLDGVEEQVSQSGMFRDLVLRFLVCRARVAASLKSAEAAEYARAALSVAAEAEPSIPRHPSLGRPVASDELRSELTRIAKSSGGRYEGTMR